MSNFAILMFIFGFAVTIVGIYMFMGNELKAISWKAAFHNLDKKGWKNVGKWTIFASLVIYLVGFIAFIFNI